jgi:hypothetical protein
VRCRETDFHSNLDYTASSWMLPVNLDRGDWLVVLLREKIRTQDPRVGFLVLDEWIGAGYTRWTDENHAN